MEGNEKFYYAQKCDLVEILKNMKWTDEINQGDDEKPQFQNTLDKIIYR